MAPFPTTKKGKARPGGLIRTEEILNTVTNGYSTAISACENGQH